MLSGQRRAAQSVRSREMRRGPPVVLTVICHRLPPFWLYERILAGYPNEKASRPAKLDTFDADEFCRGPSRGHQPPDNAPTRRARIACRLPHVVGPRHGHHRCPSRPYAAAAAPHSATTRSNSTRQGPPAPIHASGIAALGPKRRQAWARCRGVPIRGFAESFCRGGSLVRDRRCRVLNA